MVKYLIKTEVGGWSVSLMESDHCYCVVYGMGKDTFAKFQFEEALECYLSSVKHALECEGLTNECV